MSDARQPSSISQKTRFPLDFGDDPDVSITEPDSLFTKWKDQGVLVVVTRTALMRAPDREVLLALLRWFDLNVAER